MEKLEQRTDACTHKFENVPKGLDDLGERLSEQSI